MASKIAELLSAARRKSFVGREQETGLFRRFLQNELSDCLLLYFFGTGGQGKTTLSKHLADVAAAQDFHPILIDARAIEPHPAAFLDAVRTVLEKLPGAKPAQNVFDCLAELPGDTVLFVDTYEKIAPIDDWVRTDFLPQLPANTRTVIMGRNAPSLAWATDAGWKMLMRAVQLRNFTPEQSREYLTRRHIPEAKIPAILEFTHGHPLALSVVADIYEQFPDKNFSPDESPDIVRTLLQLFVRQVPSPMHRAALEACALVNILTESLLAETMGVLDASELFEWLCGLSFIEIGRDGIFPHDTAREALCADLRWRHPDWNAELHNRTRAYYHRKLKETSGEAQRKVLFDLLYLHRLNPMVKPFFDWQETGSFWVDTAAETDFPTIRDMALQMEGGESLAAVDFWWKHPAAQFLVWRDGSKQATAFLLKINAHELAPGPKLPDAPMQKVLEYQHRRLHLRSGELFFAFRLWMAHGTHQGVSPLQSSIFLTIVQHYFTPGLGVSMFVVVQPEFWKTGFTYADLTHVQDLDFQTNNLPFGWYMHDWRVRPALAWLELLGKRELDQNAEMEAEAPRLQVVVLSEAEFGESVGEALKNYHNTNQLLQNPLVLSKFIVQESGMDANDGQRVGLLREKIQTVLKEIEASPVDMKYHRVLYRTFINPVGSQEKTADFLNMSFSTYRRYLATGIQRVTEMLWALEVQ